MRTLCDILDRVARDDLNDLLQVRRPGEEAFRMIPASAFLADVEALARGLGSLGVGRGDRVGLICENRPEWHVVDFACHRLGAILVPLFPTLASAEVGFCFKDSSCRLLVVDTLEQLEKVVGCAADLPELENVVLIEAPKLPHAPIGAVPVHALAEVMRASGEVELAGPEGPDSVATIIYTSGTTGPPKGVVLTHGNFVANIAGVAARTPAVPGDLGLSLLPLNHAYERTIDYTYLAAGARIAYSSPPEVSTDFKLARPTIMIGVPRLYEKLRDAVEARVASSRPFDQRVYATALNAGMQRARRRLLGEHEDLLNRLLYPLLDFLVLAKIRDVTGGRLRLLSAGGAALDPALNWWYAAIGWELLQGYGLSETSPIISANAPGAHRIGSVGQALDNVEVRIAEDGEVLTRGPHVMPGYWNLPEATAETIVDGWLHTGDIGRIDEDGYLHITDRKKSLIVTSTGKKVAPQPLENHLVRSPWIEQVMVLGDDRRFIAALLVPAWDRVVPWAEKKGLSPGRKALATSAELRELIQKELDRLQEDFANYERVRDFRLLAEPFTVESGQLTPTLKLVRRNVTRDYADTIEDIYGR